MRAVAIVKFAIGTRKEQNMFTRCKVYEILGTASALLLVCGTQLNALQLTLWQAREKALEARSKPAGSQDPSTGRKPAGRLHFL